MPPDASTTPTTAPEKPPKKQQEARRTEGPTGEKQAAPQGQQEKKLRSRHEAFCQYFVLYGSAANAAREAGYAPQSCKNQGYRLMRQPRIRARVAQIRRELARAYALDAEVLLGKLETLYQRANEDHHFTAAVRAVEVQARISDRVKAFAPTLAKNDDQ